MGRHKIENSRHKYISIRITERDQKAIQTVSKAYNLNRSALIRYLLVREYRELQALSSDQLEDLKTKVLV